MQESLMEEDIANIDITNVAALQQKRTLAFVNHFVMSTVQFLNNFLKSCEEKLMQFEKKLEKVNANMVLLEAKLSSVPEVNLSTQTAETKDSAHLKSEQETVDQPVTKMDEALPAEEFLHQSDDIVKVKPEYEKFIKMVQVGVPLDAVKLKISLEGLDPQELDKCLKK